jgi:hypothetical protein
MYALTVDTPTPATQPFNKFNVAAVRIPFGGNDRFWGQDLQMDYVAITSPQSQHDSTTQVFSGIATAKPSSNSTSGPLSVDFATAFPTGTVPAIICSCTGYAEEMSGFSVTIASATAQGFTAIVQKLNR